MGHIYKVMSVRAVGIQRSEGAKEEDAREVLEEEKNA